jgi:hypothetical protein
VEVIIDGVWAQKWLVIAIIIAAKHDVAGDEQQ